MAAPKITNVAIYNKSKNKKIYCLIQSQKSAVTSQSIQELRHAIKKESGSNSMSVSASVSGKYDNKISSYEASVSSSYAQSNSHANKNDDKKMDKASFQFTVSNFIDEGWNEIPPRSIRKFAVQGPLWYISCVDGDGNAISRNWNTVGKSFAFDGKHLNEVGRKHPPKQPQKPQKKVVKYKWGSTYGGSGGRSFAIHSERQIEGIRIYGGKYVDALQVRFKGDKQWSARYGGNGGRLTEYICDVDEYFAKVIIRSGGFIDYVEFRTNKANFVRQGGNGGKKCKESVKGVLCGIRGRCGGYIDQIQFKWQYY
eukprot:298017_1